MAAEGKRQYMAQGLNPMSPMLRETAPRRTTLTIFLVLMFLFADLLLPQALDYDVELGEQHSVSRVTSTVAASADTYMDEFNPSTNYNQSGSGSLGVSDASFESRLLFEFPINSSSAAVIHSATLNIVCDEDSLDSSDISIYAASPSAWNSSTASWIQADLGSPWNSLGADGSNDRSAWEPPFRATTNGTFSLNVTAIAQDAVATNQSSVDILLSALGSHYECSLSEATNLLLRPELVLVTSATAAGNGGSVISDFAVDGMPLMTGDLVLTADTTPTLTYNSLVGTHVEFQLSLNEDFKTASDLEWHYSTIWDSFTTASTTGAFSIPATEQFSNGSQIFYRVRSVDSTDTLSSWSSTESFSLPAHSVTDNGDGTASIEVDVDDLGPIGSFIEDTYSNQLSKNSKYGSSNLMETTVTSNKESLIHIRFNLGLLGLPSNATIVDAQVDLTRDSSINNAHLSMHEMIPKGLDKWKESELTWNRASNVKAWGDGGREYSLTASDTGLNGSQSSEKFSFKFTNVLQKWVESGSTDSADFMITARGQNEAYSTTGTKSVVFFSSEVVDEAKKPVVSITYAWGPSSPLSNISLTAPLPAEAVWNQSGHNFTANLTPSVSWVQSNFSYEMVLQLATDEQFRDRVFVSNTAVDNDFTPSDGILNMTGNLALTAGNMYFWRMAYQDSDGRFGPWATSSFLVSSLESTWLGDDRYEFRMKHGNGTNDGLYPECLDTYIDSGTPSQNYNDESKLLISYNAYPIESMALLNCNLRSNLLPVGYAVESAHLSMMIGSTPSNSPQVAVWESRQQNWTDSGATWNSYDGQNNWGMAGAKGWERSSLLDSVQLSTTYVTGDRVDWNVTLGVQNAMRENRSVDFLIGILGAGTGQNRDVQLYPGLSPDAQKPELTFVYVPGSNAVPLNPVPLTPLNGVWSMGTGVDQTPEKRPTLNWSFGSNLAVGGWAVQLDTSPTFDSTSLQTQTSWNDAGFDITNLSYTSTTDLDDGETWYWRVRAISSTNQIGNWSNSFSFSIPDLTTWQTCPDGSCASVELHHREAMPSLNTPNFIDTYVIESGNTASNTYNSSSQMKVGAVGYDRQAISLIRIPLNSIPQPMNARVTSAQIHLYSESSSSQGEPIAVRPVYQNWTTGANGTTYDGTNNWSQQGGRDIGVDLGPYVDLQDSVSSDWMTWDVSEAVQAALGAGSSTLSLALYASNEITAYLNGPNVVTFTSTEGLSSRHPWLNLTWSNGTNPVPTTSGVNVGPVNNTLSWDINSHALLANDMPEFSWSYGSSNLVDDWRIHIFENAADDMAGRYTYDSRVNSNLFDLPNLTFTPSASLNHAQTIRWTIQPIQSGMIGPQSASTLFHIPDADSGEINSTHAWVSLQEGSIVESQNYPFITQDTLLDEGNSLAQQGGSSYLAVGQSSSNSILRSSSLIEINFSTLPLPSAYEVSNATLELSVVSGSDEIFVTVSEMITGWDETSTWSYPGNNTTSWVANGAYHSADSMIPETNGFWINGSSVFEINVTSMLQHAIERGQESLNLLIQPEEIDGTVDGTYYIASSEYVSISDRPKLTMTYELTTPWSPLSPTNIGPVDGSTLWNLSAPSPSGAESYSANWSSSSSNQTQWVVCGASEPRMVEDLECADTGEMVAGNISNTTWDALNLTVLRSDSMKGDEWQYWRVRGDQDGRIGHWSNVNKFRIPEDQGFTDGLGNYTVELSRGSIFSQTGLLPHVPDAEVSSSSTANLGSLSQLNLGTSASGTGESQIYLEFDLSSMPWPTTMTPTSMLLGLYRTGVSGTTSTTISAHACSSFVESSVSWNSNVPCLTSEITRSTLTLTPAIGWVEWDLTSLAQDNVANGNLTMTVLLKSVGTPSTNHAFASSEVLNETYRPRLVVQYVDNVNGVQPPPQPVLTSPQDGEVLYNITSSTLKPDDKPVLSWSSVTGATGYVVTIANETGVYKYNSWESLEIIGTSFRFADSLTTGEVFTWWVQGVNQSIPGPSSSRWSFAIGDPHHTDNNDLTYTYTFQTGNEVVQFGHTNIRETHLSEASPSTNYGDAPLTDLGTYYGANSGMEARMTFALDNGQVPLPAYSNIHSASLGLYLDSWIATGGANEMTFSVHRILNNQWAQSSSTWNASSSASTGTWGAPGMQAGVDYDATAVSTFVDSDMSEKRWVWFDIGVNGMLIDNNNAWIILATPNRGTLLANFVSSENGFEDNRPIIHLNHTNVTSIDLTPTAPTTDADTSVAFSYVAVDHLSMAINAPVLWSASNGSITQAGVFTPYSVGQQTVSACFGIICKTEIITVTPGAPVDLIVQPESATISADDTLQITAYVIDQNGNIVSGQSLTYLPSNGSMDALTEGLFLPHTSGVQTVQVSWVDLTGTTQTTVVSIVVETGIPSYFELDGCQGTIPAGILCAVVHTLFDQFGNEITDLSEAGSLTWSTTNGNYTELSNEYFPDQVGEWYLNLTTTSGALGSLMLTVGHGEIESLELIPSATSITADEQVWINTTRIDVRGNRLPVNLSIENWVQIQDGQLFVGEPALWTPSSRGAKNITANYETINSSITISVQEGAIVSLVLMVDNNVSTWGSFNITADDILDVQVWAYDQEDNRWAVTANWSILHSVWDSQSALEQLLGEETTFVPYYASTEPYMIKATYVESTSNNGILHQVGINVSVSHGVLESISVTASGLDGVFNTDFDITADQYLVFSSELSDYDSNPIDPSILEWYLIDLDSGVVKIITESLLSDGMRWNASRIGNWTITASVVINTYPINGSVDILVRHGEAIIISADLDTLTQTAGGEIKMTVTGQDSDGNSFPQLVEWSESGVRVESITPGQDEGSYLYFATIAGSHTLDFSVGTVDNQVNISVAALFVVDSITIELSSESIDQLGNFTVTVKAFDVYLNPIPIPSSANVDVTGRAEVLNQGQGVWNIITLDDGPQTITITAGKVSEERTVEVAGNIGGFFQAGGTLYYVGAVLIAIVSLVIVGLLVSTLRGGDTDYDDDDDYSYDADDDEPKGPAPGPSGPAPGAKAIPKIETTAEDDSWQVEHRVDDDGTEWAEDEKGTWWYRQEGEGEWGEWTE